MMSLNARRELLRAVLKRYQAANKRDKNQILNEFVEATGHERKYEVTLLNRSLGEMPVGRSKSTDIRCRRRKYGPDVERPLLSIWRISGGLCPKRLIPFLPEMREAVAEEMNGLSQCNTEEWHRTDIGIVFQDNLQNIIDLQDQLDDLRTNF